MLRTSAEEDAVGERAFAMPSPVHRAILAVLRLRVDSLAVFELRVSRVRGDRASGAVLADVQAGQARGPARH